MSNRFVVIAFSSRSLLAACSHAPTAAPVKDAPGNEELKSAALRCEIASPAR